MYDQIKLLLSVLVLIHFSQGEKFQFDQWSDDTYYKNAGWECFMQSLFHEEGMNISINITCNSPEHLVDYTMYFSRYLQQYIDIRTKEARISTGKVFNGKNVSYLRIVNGPDLWLPNIICELEGLRYLEVIDSKIETLSPTCLRQLQKLSVLKVVNSNLTYFKDIHPYICTRFNGCITENGMAIEEDIIYIENNEYERNQNLIQVSQQLDVLDLSYNNMKAFPLMQEFHPKSNLISNGILNIEGNPWVCDCTVMLGETLMKMKTSGRLRGPLCSQPANLQGQNLFDLKNDSLKCEDSILGLSYIINFLNIDEDIDHERRNLILIAINLYAIDFLMVIIIVIVWSLKIMLHIALTLAGKRQRWSYFARILLYKLTDAHPFDVDECLQENKLYDIFLSYAPKDEENAKKFASKLQTSNYSVVMQNRKIVAGEPVLEKTISVMKTCRRTICLLSPNFFTCRLNMVVLDHMFEDAHCDTRLILFRLEPSKPIREPMNTFIKQNEIKSERWLSEWNYNEKRLFYHLPQKHMEITDKSVVSDNSSEDSKPDFDSDSKRKYDVFISYCDGWGEDGEISEESRWTRDLAKQLEQDGYKVFIHSRDFRFGVPIFDNIDIAIESSKRVMCILSTDFCASAFCNWEFQVAYGMQMTGNHRILAVLFEGIDSLQPTRTVKSYLDSYSYLDRAEPNFYESLLRSLPNLHD